MMGGWISEDGFDVGGSCVGNGIAMGRNVSDGIVVIKGVIKGNVVETVFECFCEWIIRRNGEECGVWRDRAFGFGGGGCCGGGCSCGKLITAFFKVGYFTFIL